jgi:Zn-dependent protease
MFLGEPAPTAADLHFRLFGIPVRVHPFFWVTALLLGMGGGPAKPLDTFVWVAVVFVSILVHEMGHASLQRLFGGRPWITLYGFGGLASCKDCDRSPRSQILILLAGPGAGFLLAAALITAVWLAGHGVTLVVLGNVFEIDSTVRWQWLGEFVLFFAHVDEFGAPFFNIALGDLLFVNILWGLINLLPVYPLDGGQIARELFTLRHPRQGIVQSLQLSVGTAILVGIYAVTERLFFTAILFGFLAYGSYQALAAYRGHWR